MYRCSVVKFLFLYLGTYPSFVYVLTLVSHLVIFYAKQRCDYLSAMVAVRWTYGSNKQFCFFEGEKRLDVS